ncbi:MAG: glycosyltransferase family 39 protein [Candidatus Omnitrophica bacterium]|nr:glycosyltransferase family 39 protein [Candidatus Omnitrophota bacterium]MBU1128473.1 glycosyltransferase family 39 protein [Candidatus Omnitrophota bacterium]MBU1784957.1 glycosyltransferase family 39 protein [Candidatus Omnitrophota bacterium]MBU1851315.1 glycosyltransferase family 39 protein [Candidatus Omnitrophota bacterium]
MARHITILLLISLFLFLFGLGNMALTDPDETFYAQTAKEMASSGEWVTPVIFGQPQFEKPILYYWLIEISYKFFGINEFSARLPSALFGIAGILGIYFIARLIFSPLCGLLSGFAMASCVQYIILSRGCVTDMVLTVLILFSFLFFLYGFSGRWKGWYLVSAAMCALAVLTKGPIGLFVPGVVIMGYLASGGRWKQLKKIPVFWSIAIFLIVCMPWYILITKIHGSGFINEFFGFRNMTRFLEAEHRIGSSPFFYIPVIIGGIFPWTSFLFFGAWAVCRKDRFVSGVTGHKLFLSLWFLVVFVFFSVSKTKLVTYVLPLFPVIAIVIARFWEMAITPGSGHKMARSMNAAYLMFIILTFAGLIGSYLFARYEYVGAAKYVLLCGGIFYTGILLSIFFFIRGKKLSSFFAIVLSVMLVIVPLVKSVLPFIEARESSKYLALKVKEMAGEDEPVGGESDHRGGVAFYTDRTDIEDIHSYEDLITFISMKKRVWGIIKVKHCKELEKQRKDLYIETVLGSGKYVIITNKPYRSGRGNDEQPEGGK